MCARASALFISSHVIRFGDKLMWNDTNTLEMDNWTRNNSKSISFICTYMSITTYWQSNLVSSFLIQRFTRLAFRCRWQHTIKLPLPLSLFTSFLHCNFLFNSQRCKLSHFLYFILVLILIFFLSLVSILIRRIVVSVIVHAQFVYVCVCVCVYMGKARDGGMVLGGGNDENRPFNLLCFTHFR